MSEVVITENIVLISEDLTGKEAVLASNTRLCRVKELKLPDPGVSVASVGVSGLVRLMRYPACYVFLRSLVKRVAFPQDYLPYPRGIKSIARQTLRGILPSSRAEKVTSLSAVPRVGGRSKICSKERRRHLLFRTLGRPPVTPRESRRSRRPSRPARWLSCAI
jgi:hypothetical protein